MTRSSRGVFLLLSLCCLALTLWCVPVSGRANDLADVEKADTAKADVAKTGGPSPLEATPYASRSFVLVASFTVFVLSVFVGFEIIAKVPPTLHTPLMSGSNAISGITVVGAIIAAGNVNTGFGSLLGLIAIVLAMINVVGGFVVTHRMLLMFKKR